MTEASHLPANGILSGISSPLAVLISGGIDSAVLLAESIRLHAVVHPLYVRAGLHWEEAERIHLERFLQAMACPALQQMQILEVPVADLYGHHWSLTGDHVPDDQSADEAVYLPGRNLLLLTKAILWCHLRAVPALALAVLEANPFPDATPAFFTALENVMNHAVGGKVTIHRPYSHMTKAQVIERGRALPLAWTFSCLRPVGNRHCGECNKCAERRRGFVEAGLVDPTPYVRRDSCTA